MEDFSIELFGKFNGLEIRSLIDKYDHYWFTQETIAQALDIDRTTIAKIRANHPSEFSEGDEWTTGVIDGKRKVVFSEEGFLTICDMSTSPVAFRLRRWMRKQFRVRQEGKTLQIHRREEALTLPREDLSDLSPQTRALKGLVDGIVEHEIRIAKLEKQKSEIEQETQLLKEDVEQNKSAIKAIEEKARLQPGEMTALQLAHHCGWTSKSGGAHNLAVILAAVNEGFDLDGLMVERDEEGPQRRTVQVQVFTVEGVAKFLSEIDNKYDTGEKFEVTPNKLAQRKGYKCSRYVLKS
jgi:prophage antirepressor-like protein